MYKNRIRGKDSIDLTKYIETDLSPKSETPFKMGTEKVQNVKLGRRLSILHLFTIPTVKGAVAK